MSKKLFRKFIKPVIEEGALVRDYEFKIRYTDKIGRDRYIFQCIKCGNYKEVSVTTVQSRNFIKTFDHSDPNCKNYKCVEVSKKIKKEFKKYL